MDLEAGGSMHLRKAGNIAHNNNRHASQNNAHSILECIFAVFSPRFKHIVSMYELYRSEMVAVLGPYEAFPYYIHV
jgi:hypothetical protein